MKPSFVTRNLGFTMGIGLCLGLGLLGLSTYSISQASSSKESVSETSNTEFKKGDRSLSAISEVNSAISQPDSFITYDAPLNPVEPIVLQDEMPTPSLPIGEKITQHSALKAATLPISKQASPETPAISSLPLSVEASTVANQDIEHTLAEVIPGLATCPYTETVISDTARPMNTHRYVYHAVDLNGDRTDELMVQVLGPMTCGTGGCTTLVLEESSDLSNTAYDVVTQMSVVNFPVIVSDRTSAGWNDLLVMVSGGGAQPGYRQLKFNGQSYPTNPSAETIVASSRQLPNGKVLTVSEDVGAIAPMISATECES